MRFMIGGLYEETVSQCICRDRNRSGAGGRTPYADSRCVFLWKRGRARLLYGGK